MAVQLTLGMDGLKCAFCSSVSPTLFCKEVGSVPMPSPHLPPLQLVKNWRTSRHLFRDLDRGRTGRVRVEQLWGVLSQCGVELTTNDQFHILELLDPQLQGSVDYNHLIGAVFEEQ